MANSSGFQRLPKEKYVDTIQRSLPKLHLAAGAGRIDLVQEMQRSCSSPEEWFEMLCQRAKTVDEMELDGQFTHMDEGEHYNWYKECDLRFSNALPLGLALLCGEWEVVMFFIDSITPEQLYELLQKKKKSCYTAQDLAAAIKDGVNI